MKNPTPLTVRLIYTATILFALLPAIGSRSLLGQPRPPTEEASGFDPSSTFTPAQIREDIEAIHRALEEVHPSLYRHITKDGLDRLFARAIDSATRPLTYAELTRHITPLITAVGCAHTVILPSDSYEAFAQSTRRSFPFAVKVIGERLYLTRNYSGIGSIAPGSEIGTINGAAVKEILPLLLASYSSDGANRTSAMRWIDNDGFAGAYALYIGTPDTFTITLKAPRRPLVVPALDAGSIEANRISRYGDSLPRLLTVALDRKEHTALLTLRSFHRPLLKSQGLRFESFLDSAFTAIAAGRVTSLILDLRNNRGGSSHFGALLYSYLGADTSFRYLDGVEMTRATAPSFNPGFPWGDSSDFNRMDDGRFSVTTHPDVKPMQVAPKRFNGSLYVLIDGGTFSSTGIFAAYLHAHRKAVFVGEESGSDYHSINGYTVPLILPNSGIKILIPAQHYRYNTGMMPARAGRGVMPDFPISPDIADIVSGRDRELAFVKRLAR